MLNTSYYNATNNIKINAVTGAILKNHPKSWFERFHLDSKRAKELLVENGHHATQKVYNSERNYYRDAPNPEKDITILQMVICGDMEVMAELVYTKDYEMQFDNIENKILREEYYGNY